MTNTQEEIKKGDILLVDDRIENLNLLADMLTDNGYEVRQVLSGKQALKVVNYEPPELILLDIMMPEMDGYKVCEDLKKNPNTVNIPVIFISAKNSIFDKVKGFQIGGVDYITKPFFLPEVLCRIDTHITIYRHKKILAQEIAEKEKIQRKLEKVNQQLKKIANLDGLTEIPNRRLFDEYLAKEWQRLKREQKPLSLIMVDVDYFKAYNDNYGHLAGDDCLKQIAQALEHVIKRPADLVARYGGEEFVVVLPNTSQEGAQKIAQEIQTKMSDLAIPHKYSLISQQITLSLGISTITPHNSLSPFELVNCADQALYQAKQQGRNSIKIINYELS
jgi:diguanylate cyclase (GGDEF)-like protein